MTWRVAYLPLLLLHAHIIHILSLALDLLLNLSSFVFPFPIVYPQSPRSLLRSRVIACVILGTNSFVLILLRVCILRSHLHNVEFLVPLSSPPSPSLLYFSLEPLHCRLLSLQVPVLQRCIYHLPARNIPQKLSRSEIPAIFLRHTTCEFVVLFTDSVAPQGDGNTLVLYPHLIFIPSLLFNIVWRRCQNSCFQNPRQATRGESRDVCLG